MLNKLHTLINIINHRSNDATDTGEDFLLKSKQNRCRPLSNKYVFNFHRLKRHNIYFLSNDHVENISCNFDSLAFIGICNAHSLHVMSSLIEAGKDIKKTILFDSNLEQIRHFGNLVQTILGSKDRIDFIEKFACVRFNSTATSILKKYKPDSNVLIKGWLPEEDSLVGKLEKKLWKKTTFDHLKFKKKYGISGKKTDRGILIEGIKTIGSHNKGCITILSGDTESYPEGPFMFSYGHGYLKDERCFSRFKSKLEIIKKNSTIIHGNIYDVFVEKLPEIKYFKTITWTSNVFASYFVKKYPKVESALNLLTNMDIMKKISSLRIYHILVNDIGDNIGKISSFNATYNNRPVLDSHWSAYEKVNEYYGNKNLHVIAGKLFEEINYKNDELKSTKVILHSNLRKEKLKYDCIFLHTIFGRGNIKKEQLIELIKIGLKLSKTVLVLEHNNTKELLSDQSAGYDGVYLPENVAIEIIMTFKKCKRYYLAGQKEDKRNSLFVLTSS